MIFKLDLPSEGKVRGVPRSIWLKEWTIKDINEMSQSSTEALDDVLFTIINRGIAKEQPEMSSFNPMLLPTQDRLFILMTMKMNVVGPMYSIEYTHRVPEPSGKYEADGTPEILESCGQEMKLDLNLQEVIKIPSIPEKYHRNIGIKLPGGDLVRIRIASYDYYFESRKWYENKFGKDPIDLPGGDPDYVLFMLATYISGYNQTPIKKFQEAWEYVLSKGAEDISALADIYTYFSEWGPSLKVEGTCSQCERRYSFRLPFFESFFFDKEQFQFDLESAIEDVQVPSPEQDGVESDVISGISGNG